MLMRSLSRVCLSVCLYVRLSVCLYVCPVCALTFESLDLETSFLVCMSTPSEYLGQVRMSRSRSPKHKDQLLLLAGCFENFRVLSYVFIV